MFGSTTPLMSARGKDIMAYANLSEESLVVGVSGASGSVYAVRLLEQLRELGIETHLVISRGAVVTLTHETDLKVSELKAMASHCYQVDDIAAPIASGSSRTRGMVIVPCSMRTVGEIASGTPSSLLTRAADVVLKERRRLVIVARETPLTLVHLRNMAAITEMGGIIAPPVPAMYARPESLDDIVDHTVGRVLDLFGLDTGRVRRWRGGKRRSAVDQHVVHTVWESC
jgi:4-hydroxy-3-polyprenylbenzoate decarboxylase